MDAASSCNRRRTASPAATAQGFARHCMYMISSCSRNERDAAAYDRRIEVDLTFVSWQVKANGKQHTRGGLCRSLPVVVQRSLPSAMPSLSSSKRYRFHGNSGLRVNVVTPVPVCDSSLYRVDTEESGYAAAAFWALGGRSFSLCGVWGAVPGMRLLACQCLAFWICEGPAMRARVEDAIRQFRR